MSDVRDVPDLGGDWDRYVLEFDWASHPFGPMESWPEWMRTTTRLALASRFPIVLWFGRDLRLIYNEAYVGPLADKHPQALGEPGRVVWAEIWDVIEPMFEQVLETGVATWSDDQRLNILRHASLEECYFTFTYSPIFDDAGGVGGIFCAVHDTTQQVVAERRLRMLHELGSRLAGYHTVADCADAAIEVCESFPADLPFAGIYLPPDDSVGAPVLYRATHGVDAALRDDVASLERWTTTVGPARSIELELSTDLPSVSAAIDPAAVERGLLVPVSGAVGSEGTAWMLIGISKQRPLDNAYRSFLHLVAGQVGTAFTSADTFQAEVRRAETLEQLDRAKTVFFSNVSHELRTPLTLILSPLEEALADPAGAADHAEQLAVAHRNALRLARLVDSLLDFSRIEAGRMTVQPTAVELASVTADIASMFEAAFDRAGLEYTFAADSEPVPARVDVEMWQKIVLNLISNAFKYTHEGEVRVTVRAVDGYAVTSVADTGVGIAADDLEAIFERFHRIRDAAGRSVEGTGIGLALVRDLVNLNGGSVTVDSTPGAGSTFTVRLPLTSADVAAGQHSRETENANGRYRAYVQEALGWLASDGDGGTPVEEGSPRVLGDAARILVVDDNADMRDYLRRLLGSHWRVDVAGNAAAAMAAIEQGRPDLVVSDVMMPGRSGLDFVGELRAGPGTRDMPVILLSARAGMEASLEGLEGGADDYLTKPFVAADLIGRIGVRLEAAAQRRREAAAAEVVAALAGCTAVDQVAGALFPLLHRIASVRFCGVCVAATPKPSLRAWYGGNLPTEFHTRYHLVPLDADLPITRAAREGTPQLYGTRPALVAAYPQLETEFVASGIEALAAWPLDGAGGESRGALVIAWEHPVDVDARADQLERIAALTAQAIASIRARNHEREVAERLQESLLATRVRSHRVSAAMRYAPADATLAVGGDWYDLFDLPGERVGIVAGDVVGKGLEAATVMGQLRSALAAAALDAETPQHAVERLERFASRIAGARGTTVAYLILDPVNETLTYTRAGHPPPLIMPPTGPARFLDDAQTWPLMYAAMPRTEATATCSFPAGSLLLLYTDGLVERRGESLDAGLDRLKRHASDHRYEPLRMLTQRLLDELTPAAARTDDIAVVAVRTPASLADLHVDVIPADIAALAGARHRLWQWMDQHGTDRDPREEFLLAVGEATANAVEHGTDRDAASPVTIEAAVLGDDLVAAVSDTGEWRNTGLSGFLAGRGRGHVIMRGFTDQVDINTHRHGTTISLRRRVG